MRAAIRAHAATMHCAVVHWPFAPAIITRSRVELIGNEWSIANAMELGNPVSETFPNYDLDRTMTPPTQLAQRIAL
jgi:hypothetical protein